jgi:uncharacterized protein with HEPN domain
MPLSVRELRALEDMLRFGADAIAHVHGVDFNAFVADHKTHQATLYAIATVAESSHRITPAQQQRWPGIPWPMVWGMRNIILHEYGRVDLPTVYQVASVQLPKLLEQVRAILAAEAPPSPPTP